MSIQSRYSLRKRTISNSNEFITNDNQVQLSIEPREYGAHLENNNVKEIRVKLEEYEEEEVERLAFVSQESYSERNNITLQVSQSSISKRVKQEDSSNGDEQRQPMVIPASVDALPSEAFESGSELENVDIKEESSSEVEQFISSNDMYFNESSNNDANSNSNGSEFEGNSDSENSFDDDYATGARTRSQQKNQRRTASRYNNINKQNRNFDMDEQSSGDEYMDDDDDYEYDDDDYGDDDDDDDDDDDYAEDDGNDNDDDNAIDNEKPLLLTKRKRPQEEDLTPSSNEESEEDTSTVSKPATKMGLRENTLPIRKQPQDRLYCPYRECIRSSLQRSEIYSHIRAKHNSKFPSLAHMVNVRVRLGFKTVGGKVIDFSENSRNILNDKDEILIERQEKSEGSYFCPYQSCNNRISSFRACNIYRHIRQKHDAEFPKVTTYGCFYNFKTLTGKIIDFTVDSKGTLKSDDKILPEKKKQEAFYCPYQGCNAKYGNRPMTLNHIRKKHYSGLSRLKTTRTTFIFKTCSGKEINFDLRSKSLLKKGDTIQLVKSHRQVQFYCPYKGCDTLRIQMSPLLKHIQKHHYPALPGRFKPAISSYIFKTNSGVIIDFSEDSQNLLCTEDKLLFYKREEEEKEQPFQCPYKRCNYSANSSRGQLFNHIRTHHDRNLPFLNGGKSYTFKTTSGHIIKFRGKSQKLLRDSDKIVIVEKNFAKEKDELIFYCPYKECTIAYPKMSIIASHIRSRHYAGLQTLKTTRAKDWIWRTASGRVIDFENSKNMLKNGDKIILEKKGEKKERQRGYCPYQGCDSTRYAPNSMYQHIREKHYPELPYFGGGRNMVYKTVTGEPVYCKDSSHKPLKEGDILILAKNKPKDHLYCPYQGCDYSRAQRNDVYMHIRSKHYPDFHRATNTKITYIFKTPSGQTIDFTENSQSLLKSGEKIVPEKEKLDPERLYCPYQGCDISRTDRTGVYSHIRERHYSELPLLKVTARRVNILKTPAGKIMNFSENEQDLLKEGDKIIAELERGEFCCPYQNCDSRRKRQHELYSHIRERHDPEFPRMPARAATYYTIKNSSGDDIEFNESSANMLKPNEKIVVKKELHQQDSQRFYCPYQGCDSSSIYTTGVIGHIRDRHFSKLPQKLGELNKSYFLKTASGQRLTFDVQSKNLLATGDTIVVDKFTKRKRIRTG